MAPVGLSISGFIFLSVIFFSSSDAALVAKRLSHLHRSRSTLAKESQI
jgi:hypothetical protein